MLAVPGYSKADSSAAVFGSFTSETRAIALSKDVSTQLNIRTRVVQTHEMTTPYQLVRAAHRAAASCDRKKLSRALSDPSWSV